MKGKKKKTSAAKIIPISSGKYQRKNISIIKLLWNENRKNMATYSSHDVYLEISGISSEKLTGTFRCCCHDPSTFFTTT